MKDIISTHHSAKTACPGKIRFPSYGPKYAKFGHFGTVFQMRISRERKEQIEIRLDFHRVERLCFQYPRAEIPSSSLLRPENRGRKSGSETGPDLRFRTFLRKSSH